MELRSSKDLYSGAALAAFGLYVTIGSARLTYVSEDGPGPGFLPFWLGIAICCLALCLIFINQLRPASKARAGAQSWSGETRALSAWLALMGAVLLSPLLGFTVCLALVTVYIIAFMERRPLWSAVIVALGLSIGFHLIFVVLLGLSLPTGPLGF
jgi:putative tricarboxylic transport membrane protein